MTTRSDVRRIPLSDAVPPRPGVLYITMAVGQWDATLAAAYDAGWTLLEMNDDERPVRAYRKELPS